MEQPSANEETVKLTEDEAEQYDRQIRLWGLEAQKRLRTSSLLVVGLKGLTAEVCKNVVLAGVKSVTILDDEPLGREDLGCRFLATVEGENRARQAVPHLQSLNPNVTVRAEEDSVLEKPDEYFKVFDIVCASCCTTDTLLRLNRLCRENGTKFFCGDIWGYYGYFFSDLNEHHYAIDVPKEEDDVTLSLDEPRAKRVKRGNPSDIEMITVRRTQQFCSLQDALSVDWGKKPAKYFRRTPATFFTIQTLQAFRDTEGRDPAHQSATGDSERLLKLREEVASKYGVSKDLIPEEMVQHCCSELSPVCAIVGGVLGQEIIKAMSGKDKPYHNCFIYDGLKSNGIVESLLP